MPKYFEGNKKLPYAAHRCILSELSVELIRNLRSEQAKGFSLIIRLDGMEECSEGYIFNIKPDGDKSYKLVDIAGLQPIATASAEELLSLIQHVIGVYYSPQWQSTFHRLRNEIVSTK